MGVPSCDREGCGYTMCDRRRIIGFFDTIPGTYIVMEGNNEIDDEFNRLIGGN